MGLPVIAALMSGLAGCQSEMPEGPHSPSVENVLTVSGSLLIPDMPVSMTRGKLGDAPGANLKLTVLEFEKGADAANSFLSNIYRAELNTASNTTGTVEFKFTVMSSATPKTLQLIVADDYVTPSYGSEASLMPELYVGSAHEAYWGRVEFPQGLTAVNADGQPELRDEVWDMLRNVPVIRNFAKITVTENLDNFDLLGFDLVNVPTSGTIGPWNQTSLSIPDLIDGNKMLSYQEITKTLNYKGVLPSGVRFDNTEAQAKEWTAGLNSELTSNRPRYIYEHPYESTRRTYLIINGLYRQNAQEAWQHGFYKVDIGRQNDATGTFDYYDIIRSIQYNVVISSVSTPGSATVAEAIARAPFNNLIAATETSSMLNVSDGTNMLIVNDTNHIIVDETETVDVLFRYIKDVTGSQTADNTIPHAVGLEAGPVIKSFTGPEVFKDAMGAEWIKYTITPNPPTGEVKTQDFTIVDGSGLGRTIHLILRTPWQYAPITGTETALIKNGTADTYTDTTNDVISAQAQQPLTVYFNLPDGLPESMFPLEFRLEAKNQGIENNKIGTLVVSSGPSLFDPSKIAISYVKTVNYSEYLYNVDSNNSVDVNSPNANHTVRCRFLTITATTDNDAEIMIHNPYFSPNASVKFIRQ